MNKSIFVITLIIIILIIGIFLLNSHLSALKKDKIERLYWVSEESYFVDYEIVDSKKVRFRYSICFVNNTKNDMTISLGAKFKQSEIKEWLKQSEFLTGYNDNHEPLYSKILSGEKKNIIFMFEGEYLNGKINRNLSFPEEIILTTSFS